jgi:hypothetical protein
VRKFRSSNTSLDGVIQADRAFVGPVLAGEAPKGWFD